MTDDASVVVSVGECRVSCTVQAWMGMGTQITDGGVKPYDTVVGDATANSSKAFDVAVASQVTGIDFDAVVAGASAIAEDAIDDNASKIVQVVADEHATRVADGVVVPVTVVRRVIAQRDDAVAVVVVVVVVAIDVDDLITRVDPADTVRSVIAQQRDDAAHVAVGVGEHVIRLIVEVPVVAVGNTAQINTVVGVGDVVGIAAVVVAIDVGDLISVGAAAVIGRVVA